MHKQPSVDDLVAYGYAPGEYMITCQTCGFVASGCDKHAYACRTCATKAFDEADADTIAAGLAAIAAEAEMEPHPKKRYWHPRVGEQFVYENEIILFVLTDSNGNAMTHVGKVARMIDDGYGPPAFDIEFRATWVGEDVRGGNITLKNMMIWRYMVSASDPSDRDPTPVELEDIRGAFSDEDAHKAFYRNAEGTRVYPWGKPELELV